MTVRTGFETNSAHDTGVRQTWQTSLGGWSRDGGISPFGTKRTWMGSWSSLPFGQFSGDSGSHPEKGAKPAQLRDGLVVPWLVLFAQSLRGKKMLGNREFGNIATLERPGLFVAQHFKRIVSD